MYASIIIKSLTISILASTLSLNASLIDRFLGIFYTHQQSKHAGTLSQSTLQAWKSWSSAENTKKLISHLNEKKIDGVRFRYYYNPSARCSGYYEYEVNDLDDLPRHPTETCSQSLKNYEEISTCICVDCMRNKQSVWHMEKRWNSISDKKAIEQIDEINQYSWDSLRKNAIRKNPTILVPIELNARVQSIQHYYAQKAKPQTWFENIFGVSNKRKKDVQNTEKRAIAYIQREYMLYHDILPQIEQASHLPLQKVLRHQGQKMLFLNGIIRYYDIVPPTTDDVSRYFLSEDQAQDKERLNSQFNESLFWLCHDHAVLGLIKEAAYLDKGSAEFITFCRNYAQNWEKEMDNEIAIESAEKRVHQINNRSLQRNDQFLQPLLLETKKELEGLYSSRTKHTAQKHINMRLIDINLLNDIYPILNSECFGKVAETYKE